MKIKFEIPLNIYKPTIHENQLISADLPDNLIIAASVPEPESQSGQVGVRLPGQVLFIHISRSEVTFGTFMQISRSEVTFGLVGQPGDPL